MPPETELLYDMVLCGLSFDPSSKWYTFKRRGCKDLDIQVSEILNPRYAILDTISGKKLESLGGFNDACDYIRTHQYPKVSVRVRGSVKIAHPHETTIDVDMTRKAPGFTSLLTAAICKYIVEYHMFK